MHPGEVQAKIAEAYDAGELILACAWCGRLSIEEEWIIPPTGVLATIDEPQTLSHTICPSCAERPAPPS